MLQALTDRLAQHPIAYDQLRRVIEFNFVALHRALSEARERLNIDDKDGWILDLPCGTGIFATNIEEDAYVGADLEALYVSAARRRHPARHFQVADGTALPYADESFQGAILMGFLHHLDGPTVGAVLAEVARVLRPDAWLILIEDAPSPGFRNPIGWCLQKLDVGDHIRESDAYTPLLEPAFREQYRRSFASGFWNYTMWLGRKQDLGDREATPAER